MVRRFLGRGQSLDRFLPGRRVMTSSPSFSSSSASLRSSSSLSSQCSTSGRGSMAEEQEAVVAPLPPVRKRVLSRSHGSRSAPVRQLPPKNVGRDAGPPSEMDLKKERFAKLLLGEDMSGTGKGVSSALALSNSITNLAASVFGEQRRLEPMSADRRARWKKEIDWLLSVTDHIVEFVPLEQVSEDGTSMEVMGTQLRRDILMNIPALQKLDAMLLGYLDSFKEEQEFWYVWKDANEKEKGDAPRDGEKWWIPTVRVPPEGLSDQSRKWLQHQKDLVGQVLKAAMAINADVLGEMEIPEEYIEDLPKNGRESLGDSIYRTITDDYFDPNGLLDSIDLSTEHKIVDLKDRIEASVVIWQRKLCNKLSWGPGVSLEKREQFGERAETVLLILKHKFPGSAQSSLDISKIQYNKDVGFAILESYSRALESLAFAVLSRIEDVLYADTVARDPRRSKSRRRPSIEDDSPKSLVADDVEATSARSNDSFCWQELEDRTLDSSGGKLKKIPRIGTRKFMHVDKVEMSVCSVGGGLRSFSHR
ncbi:rop guanine nucleotide exchange factor 9-like [Hordeum vulgare subsp. vulgare]|uniref:PRONE domain-containing protein n=1 Tax=Hordeum vulgare subsp. vulgare TaxID=112509 RepID=A0A8I6XVH3_HORVV|nr:rop guanine nucleotide exchange factor 9-like [Hordeum vulgare subsp. vulgare]